MNTLVFTRKIRPKLLLIYLFLCAASLTGLARRPQIVTQTGHSGFVMAVAFSPNGSLLVSGGYDHGVRLWDVKSGLELRSFAGHSESVGSVAFSPDGKTIASGSSDGTARLWDVVTGLEIQTLKNPHRTFSELAFSADGKILAGTISGDVFLFDINANKFLNTLTESGVTALAFSPDGKTLGTASDGITLWDIATGREVKTMGRGNKDIKSIVFSPTDERILASGGHQIKIWDLAFGNELQGWINDNSGADSNSLAFSPDGNTLASGRWQEIDIWNVVSRPAKKRIFSADLRGCNVVFSPNGQTLAAGSDRNIDLMDVLSGRVKTTFRGRTGAINAMALSPDGKSLAGAGSNKIVKLWNLQPGLPELTYSGFTDSVETLAFSPDGTSLIGGEHDLKVWPVADPLTRRSFPLTTYSHVAAFNPDGKTIASIDVDSSVRLLDAASGDEVFKLAHDPELPSRYTSLAFSPNGKTLAIGSQVISVTLLDATTGKVIRFLSGRPDITSVAFSPNGRFVAAGNMFVSFFPGVAVWDLASTSDRPSMSSKNLEATVTSVTFSRDSKILASGSVDHKIKLWDVATGAEIRTLNGHVGKITSLVFSPDDKTLLSSSDDATIKLWDVKTGTELCSLIALDENGWLVITPDGLFDGSSDAWKQLMWRFNNDTFNYVPVEAFFSDFYYPDLLADIFAGKRPVAPSDISKKDRRQAQLAITLTDAQPKTGEIRRNIKVNITVSTAPAGAEDLRIFRNGSLVKVWHGDVLKGKDSVTLEATVPIVAGDNNLTAYVFNHDNVKSTDATLTIKGADGLKRKGVAYVLSIGVNSYANAEYNLTYASADAKDFSDELKRQQEKLGNFDHVEVVSLNDKDATKANIIKALADISAKIQPEDSLTIYFAGHGTAEGNRFYLIPHDLGYTGSREKLDDAGLKAILSHSISDEELETAVEGIDAGQTLLVIDACNSGQALEAEEKRRGPMNSKGLAQLAYEKGMYILTAAQSYQAAKEAAKLGHGFLTYALVEEGLKTPAADKEPKDGQVLLREWLDFATQRVPQMQEADLKTRELTREKTQPNSKIPTAETDNIQRPRVFYRRETEPHPMVIVRP